MIAVQMENEEIYIISMFGVSALAYNAKLIKISEAKYGHDFIFFSL